MDVIALSLDTLRYAIRCGGTGGGARKQLAAGFIKEHKLDFTNLLAELPQVQQFGGGPFMGTPTFYIYSPKGKLLAYQAGPVTQEQIEQFMAKGARDPS